MRFSAFPMFEAFAFAEPVGFSLGRTFVKVSARCYRERFADGSLGAIKYTVGRSRVEVNAA